MTNKIDTILKAITDRIAGALLGNTIKNPKLNQDDDSHIEELELGENAGTCESEVEYFNVFPTRSELAYHNWIMRRKLDLRENSDRGVSNFMGRIKGIRVFIGNFTYVTDIMIVEDISSIIDPRLSQVVLGKPFVEISNMTHDPTEGVVRFTNRTNKVAYKMPHKIEQYNSLSDLKRSTRSQSTLGTKKTGEWEWST
ncbi:hypothetical protein Tco_1001109 [Tanacetum coccineum]